MCGLVNRWNVIVALKFVLTRCGHIKTAQQRNIIQQYGIGRLAVDRCAVTFGTARTDLGLLGPRPGPSSLYQM